MYTYKYTDLIRNPTVGLIPSPTPPLSRAARNFELPDPLLILDSPLTCLRGMRAKHVKRKSKIKRESGSPKLRDAREKGGSQ